MTPVAEVGPYEVLFRPGQSATLILAFASVGHDPTRPPAPEWGRSTPPHPTLFVTDAARSWGSAPGLAEALTTAMAAVSAQGQVRQTLGLGTSMGAFVALCATHILPIDAVIAIGPQHEPAAPWETRWTTQTAGLAGLSAPVSRARQTYILHGSDDLAQARAFTAKDHLFFPHQTHASLATHLKPALPGLIPAALSDRRRFLRLMAQAGATRFPRGPDAHTRLSPDR